MQCYEIIVGRSFTDRENVTFIKTNEQLLFAYGMTFPYHESEIPCKKVRSLNAKIVRKLVNLTANSASLVKVDIGDNQVEVLLIKDSMNEVQLNQGDIVGVIRENNDLGKICNNTNVPITAKMVKTGPMLSELEMCELLKILNHYRMCFAFNLHELGRTDMIEMDIVDNGEPVVSRPYRASGAERNTISHIVKEWKDAGIVTEIKSVYASPVAKKDGDTRLVVDYRKLNSQTVRKVFTTPNLNEHLETLHGDKIFTTLDLASGYLQVPLTESAKEKTAFVTLSE